MVSQTVVRVLLLVRQELFTGTRENKKSKHEKDKNHISHVYLLTHRIAGNIRLCNTSPILASVAKLSIFI